MHFGINTGLVVAGGMGSETGQQYSVSATRVNARRSAADASKMRGEILAGPATMRMTRTLFPTLNLPGEEGVTSLIEYFLCSRPPYQ